MTSDKSHEQGNGTEWRALLDLRFARRDNETILAGRSHRGPLRVQKALYPEGSDLCHAVILHPPGGIAGGDRLEIRLAAEAGAKALITTPGAGKWYRSGGRQASQRVSARVASGGALEWLPQETIFFDGVDAGLSMEVKLSDDAVFLGIETLCLGRVAAGESFDHGQIRLRTTIERDGRLLWSERGLLEGGSPWLHAPAGLAGYPYCATLLAVSPAIDNSLLTSCRGQAVQEKTLNGMTLLPGGFLVARCLGHGVEPLREWFMKLWTVLRPALLGRQARVPRLWYT
ncbi:MAG: urease accessory protein UreD [Deltaproteobacteria bacterium]|nr:urease accessory protein UreD [Deltaproteobacteria bacterium]